MEKLPAHLVRSGRGERGGEGEAEETAEEERGHLHCLTAGGQLTIGVTCFFI